MCRALDHPDAPELSEAAKLVRDGERVVFIIGRGGGGHKAAARAVEACFEGSSTEIETMDAGYVIEGIVWNKPPRSQPGPLDMDELYNTLMRHGLHGFTGFMGILARALSIFGKPRIVKGLAKQWKARPPALVVSFIPYFNAVFREALQLANPRATMVTCVTDFASSREHYWIDQFCADTSGKHIVVAGTPRLQRQCVEQGYPKANVLKTTGMVVHPSFHRDAPLDAKPLPAPSPAAGDDEAGPSSAGARRALVCFGGYPPMRVEAIVNALLELEPTLEVVVLCGGNAPLLKRLRARGGCVAEPMLPSERVGELMRWASFVVGKPGPGVVTEACACGTAFVTERHAVMPQEEDVLEWIEECGVGVVLDSLLDLPADLTRQVAQCMPKAIERMHANRAVFEVADLCRTLIVEATGNEADVDGVIPCVPAPAAAIECCAVDGAADSCGDACDTLMTKMMGCGGGVHHAHRRVPSTEMAPGDEFGTGASGVLVDTNGTHQTDDD